MAARRAAFVQRSIVCIVVDRGWVVLSVFEHGATDDVLGHVDVVLVAGDGCFRQGMCGRKCVFQLCLCISLYICVSMHVHVYVDAGVRVLCVVHRLCSSVCMCACMHVLQEDYPKTFIRFYLPKVALVGATWVLCVTLLTYSKYVVCASMCRRRCVCCV